MADIPDDVLLTAASDGRYYVGRGQQVTVVTAARLPEGWTRFYLQRDPAPAFGVPSPVSASQLIKPIGTKYTFTVSEDDAATARFTFELKAAKPHPLRPNHKPILGNTVVKTVFSVQASTLRYNNLDTTGAVATSGSYAFLSNPGDATTAVTTYEALRDGTTTGLLIHKSDAHGASQAALYDSVEVGDLFEWHEADDCFVRYQVTEVKPDPAGTVPRKMLAVEWMTYAFTGCSGAIPASVSTTLQWGPLPNLGGTSLSVPVVHGIYQIAPQGWTGTIEATEVRTPSTYAADREVTNIAEARTLLHWREPTVPDNWVFHSAHSGGLGGPSAGYCVTYLTEERPYGPSSRRFVAIELCGHFSFGRFEVDDASWNEGSIIRETRVIAGRPAYVIYSPAGPNQNRYALPHLWVYDPATDIQYVIYGLAFMGESPDALIAIAASLFE